MTLLQEILSKTNPLTPPDEDQPDDLLPDDENLEDADYEMDLDEEPLDDEAVPSDDTSEEDPENLNPDEELPADDEKELTQVAAKATEDPDRQGVIRNVKGSHLVYKRETEDGTYEELWVYNSGDTMDANMKIRRAILAGTDIPLDKTTSPDGKQAYTLWTAGNAELISIKGLPN